MGFRKEYSYFNKWYVVGQIVSISERKRQDESVYGTQLQIQTGDPSGFAYVTIRNTRNMPDVYSLIQSQFEIGSRVAVGFDGQWLRLRERVGNNGRTYRQFDQTTLPFLATVDQHNRIAGKVTGELTNKEIEGDHLLVEITTYDTDKDGNEYLRNGESAPNTFTFTAYGTDATVLHNTPIGANVEIGARFINQLLRDDVGDIIDSKNEVRVLEGKVRILQAQASSPFGSPQPQGSSPFGQTQAQPGAFQTQPPTQTPFGQPQKQQQATNPFGQQQATPFPFATNQ